MMSFPILSAAHLILLLSPQSMLPTATGPLRNTFVTAAETVIDNASGIDIKGDDAHFNPQMQQLRAAKDNLKGMAEDDRERDAAVAADDLIFAVAACHIQAKDGASTDRCQAQIDGARTRAMEALRVHKSNGVWAAGPPSPTSGK